MKKERKENPGIAMKIYRIERWCFLHRLKILAKIMYRLNFILFNCSIPPTTVLEEGVKMPHSTGIIIHQWSVIGKNTTIYQHVTIGNANGPKIGENCVIGSGACVLGDIVIGNDCKIGATAVGVPAKIVK